MAEPLRGSAIGEFAAAALGAVPDFMMAPVHWCAHDDTVFVEARNTGTIDGRPVVWPSIYRLIIREGRVLSGRAFYDRAAALSYVDANLADRRDEPHTTVLDGAVTDFGNDNATHIDDPRIITEFLQPYANAWSTPQPERFAPFYLPHGTMIEPLMRHPVEQPRSPRTTARCCPISQTCDWPCKAGPIAQACCLWNGPPPPPSTASLYGSPERTGFSLEGTRIRQRVGYIDSLSIPNADNTRFADSTIFTTQ